MKNLSAGVAVVLALFIGGLCGCGNYEGRIPVTGTVTLDGKPLGNGMISFVGPKGYAVASGEIREGRYALSESASRDGIDTGDYLVSIESWEELPGAELPDGSFSKGKSAIPERYQDPSTSGLTATVTPKDRKFDFELTTKE